MDWYYVWRPWELALETFDLQPRDQLYYVGMLRTIVGFGTAVFLSLPYRNPLLVLSDAANKAIVVGILAVVLVAILVPISYALADGPGQSYMQRGMPKLARLGGAGIGIAAFFALAPVLPDLVDGLPAIVKLIVGLAGLWFVAFGAVALIIVARTVLGVAQVHPLLAPMIAIVIGSAFLIFELITLDANGLPLQTYLTIGLTGYATATGIALYECRIAYQDGHRIFGGPRGSATH